MKGGEKFAFSIMMIDKMRCPNCGASNHAHQSKPLKKTRSRWQPVHRSRNSEDYPLPSISLHPTCQSRLMGSPSTTMRVKCDGCPSAFNCLTGNVDDGNGIVMETQEEMSERLEKQKNKAQAQLAAKELKDKQEMFEKMRDKLGKLGFSYEFKSGIWYARFAGTLWKLDTNDRSAILTGNYNTSKTIVIKNTLTKRKIQLSEIQKFLEESMLDVLRKA